MPKTRRNGEGTIRLREDGRWEVRVSGGIDFSTGKLTRISKYAHSEEEAVNLLHRLSFQLSNNHSKIAHMTLGEWLDLWLQVYMQHSLKQSTYNSYDSYAKNHFKPALGNVRLEDLTPRLLQQFYNYKVEECGLSPKTIRNLNLYLHKALDHAQKEGIISSNPASGVMLPKSQRPQIEILTRDQQARLVQASYQHRYGVFVRLVLSTGLRLGELVGLKWEDIDFRTNMLYVRRTLGRLQITNLPENYSGPRTEIVMQEPKTENSVRSIPLLSQLVQDLQVWRRTQMSDQLAAGEQYRDTGMLVTNPLGGYIEPRTFSDYYNQMLDMAGLPHFTFHALRHTFASRAMEQGMDEKTLSVLLGHYSVSFTLDTYAHVLNDHKREGINLMEELYLINNTLPQNLVYPILVTPVSGQYQFTAPDFPEISLITPTVEEGVTLMNQTLRDATLTMAVPPAATPLSEVILRPDQFMLQVPLSP